MKKLLFLLLLSVCGMQAQTLQNPTFGNTTTNTLKIKTPATVTNPTYLATVGADGSIDKVLPDGLSTENRIAVNDVSYIISGSGNKIIAYTAITADRTVTLPNATTANQRIWITDESGLCSNARRIIVQPFGTDVIGGDSFSVINFPNGSGYLESNGAGKWNIISTTAVQFSAGVNTLPTYTDNGNGTVTLGTGVYALFSNTNGTGRPKAYQIAGGTFTMTDNSNNYIYANYNTTTGAATLQQTTTETSINQLTQVPIFSIYRQGLTLHPRDYDTQGVALANKLNQSIYETQKVRVVEGGLLLGETASPAVRTVTVSAGSAWVAGNKITLGAVNSVSNTCYRIFPVAGVFQTTTVITQYDNTQYSDGTNLQTLTNGRYGVRFVYRSIGQDNDMAIVVGEGDNTLGQAQVSVPPANLPAFLRHMVLVGRIIVQKNAATATQIDQNTSGNTFAAAGVTDHNALNNLQTAQTGVTYGHITDGAQTIAGVKDFSSSINIAVSQTKQTSRYIYFIGDSYTAGTGATPTGNRFPTLTAGMLGYTETNDGIGGSKLSKRLPDANNFVDRIAAVPNYNATLAPYIVIAGGFNDAIDLANSVNYTTANYITDYQTIINTLTTTKGWPANHIVVVTPWYSLITGTAATRLVDFKNAAINIASTNSTLIFDAYTYFLNNSGTELLNAFGDGNHVANDGHRVIAQQIARIIGYSVQKDTQKLAVSGDSEVTNFIFRTLSNNDSVQELGLDASGRLTIDKNGHIKNVVDGLKQAANIKISGYASIDKDLTVGGSGVVTGELLVGTNFNLKPSAGIYPSIKTGLLSTNNGVRTYMDSYTNVDGVGAPLHIQNLSAGDIKLYGNTELVSKSLKVGSYIEGNTYFNLKATAASYPATKTGLMMLSDVTANIIDSYSGTANVGAPLWFNQASVGDIKFFGNTEITTGKTLTLSNPTTSTGAYDILTRNQSTGVVEKVSGSLRPYLVCEFFITQTGTSNPVIIIDENNLGATITAIYNAEGSYFITASSPVFSSGKTRVFLGRDENSSTFLGARHTNTTLVQLFNRYNSTGVLVDGIIGVPVEIRVYP